ncbi:phosphotransferase family protein [Prosthecobacter fusiformis]|nr:aminoglycoside phosphotransferase family protein [Prosthecobacter fusiformis]
MIQELPPVSSVPLREKVYYWKCDRPAAFHGTEVQSSAADLHPQVLALLQARQPGLTIDLKDGGGQGNHRTFVARIGSSDVFVRIEDGPERDDYIETESRIQEAVRALGVKTPRVIDVDASRCEVPFAWQLMEAVPHPDLNHWHKQGRLDLPRMAREIGAAVARWQDVPVEHYGPFQSGNNGLKGFHLTYASYFKLNLETHLDFLTRREFLLPDQADEIRQVIQDHETLLDLACGCLVHKDLALWNILGTEDEIAAFIDWDDAISGDPLDDLSLLGCFYDGTVITQALAGYTRIKPLPLDYRRRFWLHLLRNMIVKAVIRVGAGYFDRTDGFFLIGSGSSGADLRQLTLDRIQTAVSGLREDRKLATLP